MEKNDISEEILIKHYDGTATPEETEAIENWLKQSSENPKKAKDLYTLLFAYDTAQIMQKVDTEAALQKTQKHIATRHIRKVCLQWMQRVAAVMFLPMIIGMLYLYQQTSAPVNTPVSMIKIHTNPGMTTSFRLPDSTLVYLNSGSSFEYPTHFGKGDRTVYLNGEAYFEVTKKEHQRFIVNTPQGSKVEVFGTRFNLEAFENNDNITTTLIQGSIAFEYKEANNTLRQMMKPGDKIIYNTTSQKIKRLKTDGLSEVSWKDGKIILKNTNFKETLHLLSKYYQTEFIVKNKKFYNYSFTGTFTKQRLDLILEYFRISSHIRWRYIDALEKGETKMRIELY